MAGYRILQRYQDADNYRYVGLYYKLHGAHRPVNLNKPTIKRRKRVTASAATANGTPPLSADGPSALSAGAESRNQIPGTAPIPQDHANGEPARKKARKIPGTSSISSAAKAAHAHNNAYPNGQTSIVAGNGQQKALNIANADDSQMGEGDSDDTMDDDQRSLTSLPSSRPNDLTLPELAAVAALAMHANHESSLSHSAHLNNDILDSHHHPLHSSNDLSPSSLPPSATAASLPTNPSINGKVDSASGSALTRSVANLIQLRADLSRESTVARETIIRLQAFLNRSDQAIAELDGRIATSTAVIPTAVQSVVPAAGIRAASISAEPTPDIKPKLAEILAAIPQSEAQPSALLRKRRADDSQPDGKGGESGTASKATKLLWEICPSTASDIKVIAVSS